MDFQLKLLSKTGRLSSAENGLRAMAGKAPQAEALAASWIERLRPFCAPVYALRRRIATIAVGSLACLLFVHVMFGANGMVVYRQKRAEYHELQRRVIQTKQENERSAEQIHGLKTDEKAIEREAREQLHYARPGEYVYVRAVPQNPPPPANHFAEK
ncbi:MAG: septum formation initiator family protein [Candidatus Sulfotelmatobacter sp.]